MIYKHHSTLRQALMLACAAFLWINVAHAEAVDVSAFQTTSTMRDETKEVVGRLESSHYLGQTIADLDQNEFIADYMTDWDTQRMFFLETELADFQRRFSPSLDKMLSRGHLMPAFEIFLEFRQNVESRVSWVQKRLNEPFDFSGVTTYAPDRSEAEWPVSIAEANVLWERRLQFEMLNELLSLLEPGTDLNDLRELSPEIAKVTPDGVETTVEIEDGATQKTLDEALVEARENIGKRYDRLLRWVQEIEPIDVQETFLTALTHQYDPHSTFMSADTLEEFSIAMRNSLVGIGAVLSDTDGYCTIRELLPGGPAERSGKLKPEDQIVGVAQDNDGEMVDVIGMKLSKIVKMIRGKKGTTVRLKIRPGDGDPSVRKTITLTRDEIKLTAKLAKAEVFEVPAGDKTIAIGVIDLPAFYGSGEPGSGYNSTTEDVEELINKLKEIGVEGIVLDLRANGGGLLSEAIRLTGLFIPVGPVVQVRDYVGQVQEFLDDDPKVAWDGPLMVLVSRFSASASEITAGALKNHQRALIVGDKLTHGKGTVQAVFDMNRGGNWFTSLRPRKGAAKVTVQKYYLPDGSSTQIEGVKSDIVLPSINEYLAVGEGEFPHALAWDSIDSLEWDYDNSHVEDFLVNQSIVEQLQSQSQDRQGSLEEFGYLRENIDWFKARQEQKEFSLNLEERRSRRASDNDFRELMEGRYDTLAALNYTSDEILLNVTEEQNREHDALVAAQAQPADAADIPVGEIEIEEDAKKAAFDIQLREGLRIMADWIAIAQEAGESQALAAAPAGEPRS
ncbi:carboxy terminal-processing peptidase [Cerasicoccus arenae]|uniref:carboxy terminal-processing peptidase n=1 Tax=Cerasicoccus arenae TaxID=424488 RepID=UPI00167604F2|nr:carboxy terminal-processing peptidase [Cerasicoccus arenae]MBK1857711.1 carboxy terminal-processing peptidase [Cerasicoccus arenae]